MIRKERQLIEKEHVADKLTDLLRSKDDALATYAAAILFRLSEDKTNLNFGGEIECIDNALNTFNELDMQQNQLRMQHQYSTEDQKPNQCLNERILANQDRPVWFDTDL